MHFYGEPLTLIKMHKQKMEKYLILSLVILSSCTSKIQQKEPNIEWIPYEWVGDTIEGNYIDKVAMVVPFEIKGIPHLFKSQFDLGATNTVVYGNSIYPYVQKYPEIQIKIDTGDKKNIFQGREVAAFNDLNFKLDNVEFTNQKLLFINNYGNHVILDSSTSQRTQPVGTIAPDLFQGRTLIIDFTLDKIGVTLDSIIDNVTYVNVQIENGRIKVPVSINGKVKYFMYDTGASLFPLIVHSDNLNKYKEESSEVDTLKTTTWGVEYDVYGVDILPEIKIGETTLNKEEKKVFGNPREEFKQFFAEENIEGILGNSFFYDKTIVINYKTKKFGFMNN